MLTYFPGLAPSTFEQTSDDSIDYNCFAWAAGDTQRWWGPRSYWPPGVRRGFDLAAYIEAFATLGYEPCENGVREEGYEKVVIYVDARQFPTHMARQLPTGHWTSKLGELVDIRHDTLEGLAGPIHPVLQTPYGEVAQFLKRRK